ncbi:MULTISPECIES: hypothetical protein [Pseudomonas]|uniref:hypothetical protein n=1 Tax=Pseudomonas TaxID=286 RepID=UPI000F0436A0|nr:MULTISPECIES: hypothetical protein [Pseudomonas]MBD8615638.1 hypothetical protein [Pseudomonas putida]MBD8681706.1 hypothetical protein [Pseudomonas sp. CFBP 13719]
MVIPCATCGVIEIVEAFHQPQDLTETHQSIALGFGMTLCLALAVSLTALISQYMLRKSNPKNQQPTASAK